ncbi:MAG: autotransporter assembly complex family protein [Acinetobacter sp.]
MPAKIKFKKSVLAHCMHLHFDSYHINKLLCASVFLSIFAVPVSYAEQTQSDQKQENQTTEIINTQEQLESAAKQQGLPNEKIDQIDEKIEQSQAVTSVDSLSMLEQQEKNLGVQDDFKPIQFDDLEDLPIAPVDQSLTNEIFQVAEEAKKEALDFRNGVTQTPEVVVSDATQQEVSEITQAPVNVDQLIQTIRSDQDIAVERNDAATTLTDPTLNEEKAEEVKVGFFKGLINKVIKPQSNVATIPKIAVTVEGAPPILANNIKAKLSTFTQEAFLDFNGSVPQLRTLTVQAAQAVGYYNAQFKFSKVDDVHLKVNVVANTPVILEEQNIEASGAGANLAQFQVIRVLPDLEIGDIFNHGSYETTKTRIVDAATNNGFFDSYWRLHDVKVEQPQNKAKINLKYETGERYKLGHVEFRMSDPSKPLPIDLKILESMAPWQEGADYTAWRVNGLANNLTNSRYFNYTLVDAIKPDPIVKPLELPADLQALVDQEKIASSSFSEQTQVEQTKQSSKEVTQNVVNENQFAGTQQADVDPNQRQLQAQQKEKESEEDLLKDKAREEKKIPVIVTLNADRLNSLETGIGFGTDTGVRLRSQYRRAIVNHLGHSFDANFEVSQIRQSFDTRYNIPYKHPLNDYISLVAGYEREDRGGVGNDLDLTIESAVAGVDRIIKGSRKEWQHIFGVRYRLDRLNQTGVVDVDDIPDAFLVPGSNEVQQSLLFGYEATKTDSDNRVNPTRGFKQSYKIQMGSESLLTDTDMAIANATWKGLYSLGKNDNHQFVGGLDVGYIFAKDFQQVPYNLRFFAGGDQSLRGFDYKSLSPVEYGYDVGGQALAVGSLEYNYQFKEGWRAAIFSDVGNAYDKDFSNSSEYSLGLGIRWKSPIGPIRIDLASGVSDPDHPIRLHFYIGSQL